MPARSERPQPFAAAVAGRVVDGELGPLSEGRVELWCRSGGLERATSLDESGGFRAPACAEGPTCARLVHPGFVQLEPWELRPGDDVELGVASAQRLLGRVHDSRGAAIAGATVVLRRGEGLRTATSDELGSFAISLPTARPCDRCDGNSVLTCARGDRDVGEEVQLIVQAAGYGPAARELALGSEPGLDSASGSRLPPLSIELAAPAPVLRGRVLGRGGRAFDARTRVLAYSELRPDERHATRLDEDGGFALRDLGDGGYELRVVRDGLELAATAVAATGDAIAIRSERPARAARLSLRVLGDDGRPRAGVEIAGGPFRAAVSGDDGRVSATDVLPASYQLRVRAPDCGVARVSLLVGGEDAPESGTLERTIRLGSGCAAPQVK